MYDTSNPLTCQAFCAKIFVGGKNISHTVAYHGNGVYRPGKSGGDSENTPDTKPVAWAITGRRGQNLRYVRKKNQIIIKEGADGVNPKNQKEITTQEPYRFTKRIGSTNYKIAVHLSKSSRETMDDKIIRLIKNEAVSGRVARE